MAEFTKNLGQVAGVSLSNTAPTNTALIWYDTTPNQMCHKVYDTNLGQWVVINNSILATTTYSELQNQATSTGLSLGKFYIITDKGNVVATTISPTKIQYTDTQGNIVIDDLGSLQQYHVPSSNLRIDGLEGDFDDTTKTLTFNFTETAATGEDYFLGKKVLSNGLFSLFKMKLKNLISTSAENAITWVGDGFFFNFSQALQNMANKAGGVVTYEEFLASQGRQDNSITVLNTTVARLPGTITQTVNNAVTDAMINGKRILNMSPYNTQTALAVNDTFTTAWNKIQGWFNTLRYATGSTLYNYSAPTSGSAPANGDTVQTAIGKLYAMVLNVSGGGVVINPGSIGTTELADGSVTERKLGGGAVSTRTIADSAITSAKIGSSAVTNAKIANGTITLSKLAFDPTPAYRPYSALITNLGNVGTTPTIYYSTEPNIITTVEYRQPSGTNTANILVELNTSAGALTYTAQVSIGASIDGIQVRLTGVLQTDQVTIYLLAPTGSTISGNNVHIRLSCLITN